MRGWSPEDFHERDHAHDRRLFLTAPLPIGVAEAADAVSRALPALGRVDAPDGVTFLRRHHGRDVVVAELRERPWQPGSRLRYRVGYRTGPPLSMGYDTGDGRAVLAALEAYVRSRAASHPGGSPGALPPGGRPLVGQPGEPPGRPGEPPGRPGESPGNGPPGVPGGRQ